MAKILIVISLMLIFFGIGAWFMSYSPIRAPKVTVTESMISPSQTTTEATTQTTTATTQTTLKGTDAIKAYAAQQFNVSVDNLKVVSSEHQDWKDTCFDLPIDQKLCEKKATSGYQMTFEINGQKVSYRGNDEGTVIRFLKK